MVKVGDIYRQEIGDTLLAVGVVTEVRQYETQSYFDILEIMIGKDGKFQMLNTSTHQSGDTKLIWQRDQVEIPLPIAQKQPCDDPEHVQYQHEGDKYCQMCGGPIRHKWEQGPIFITEGSNADDDHLGMKDGIL